MEVGGQRHARPLYRGKETWYPVNRRLGGPQDRYGWVKKISPPTGIRSPDRQAHSDPLSRPTLYMYLATKYGTAYWTFTEEVLLGHTAFTASLCVFHFPALSNPKAQRTSSLCYVQRVSDLWHHICCSPTEDSRFHLCSPTLQLASVWFQVPRCKLIRLTQF
jgi:hypothetical protein